MYNPVAFSPFNVPEMPSRSNIEEMSGSSIPCENPDMETMMTSTQKRCRCRCCAFCILPAPLFLLKPL